MALGQAGREGERVDGVFEVLFALSVMRAGQRVRVVLPEEDARVEAVS